MTISFRKTIVATFLVGIAVATMGLGSAVAAGTPAGMSGQEYQALVIRSQALNDRYGAPEVTSEYEAMLRAETIRGEAMNRLARSGVLSAATPADSPSAAGNGFNWGDFGIGAGAVLGLVLVAIGLGAGSHYSSKRRVRPAA